MLSTQVRRSSGGFDTHFAGSPLFVEATSPHRIHPRRGSDDHDHHQGSSCPLLALFTLKEMNKFPDRATWRQRTSRSAPNLEVRDADKVKECHMRPANCELRRRTRVVTLISSSLLGDLLNHQIVFSRMTLQDLPFLVLYRILALSDSLSDLGAIGGTCQPLYSVLHNHKAILIYQVLFNKLGPVLSDALALSRIEPLDENSPSYHQQVRDFVCIYEKYLAGENRPLPKDLSLDYVLGLAKYYRSMLYLTDLYITSRLKLIENEFKISHPSTTMLVAPSRTESLRVIRAFYRIQIATNAYGQCSLRYRRKLNKPDVKCINYYLVGLWEPWEMQQIFCAVDMLNRIQLALTDIADRALHEEGMSRRVYYNLANLRDFMVQKLTHNAAWPQTLEWVCCNFSEEIFLF